MAAATPNKLDIKALVNQINLATETLTIGCAQTTESSESQHSESHDRQKLLAAAQNLVLTLELPEITALKIAKGPVGHAVLRTAFRLNIFGAFDAAETKSAADIAIYTGAQHLLIIRLMRTLVGIGIFSEHAQETYTHNPLSRSLALSTFRILITGMCETTTIMSKLPDYLAALEYENPADPHNSLFHYAHGTNLNMFQWLRTQPDQLATFSAYMAAATEIQKSSLVAIMTSLLPFNEADCSDDQHDRISLVDVGGGRGQALSKLCQQRPDLKGKLIVQDLPTEIEGREPAEGVQAMSFDFFTPQIIEGAQIYFFTHVFHNWPLGACRQILTNTLPALTPNLSRLFIIDQVVPDSGASAFTAFMDISMMAFGGMERTERQWRELLESVGLTVMRIESPSSDSLSRDSVIEAMLKI